MTHEQTTAALTVALARIEELAAELAAVRGSLTEMEAYKASMIAKVSSALQSEDPFAQFTILADEFLTPEQERVRAEKIAQLEALKAELGIE